METVGVEAVGMEAAGWSSPPPAAGLASIQEAGTGPESPSG